jgi:4a-hydroxytetrahydrobiopterin dehydratase
MPPLNAAQAKSLMKSVPGWSRRARVIHRKFQFEGFMGSIDFVNRVARAAQKADHHPDINIRWNKVSLALTTHSQGGLTGKDFSMARQCSAIFSRLSSGK